ncbi:hypothetical protein DCC62_22095 [candidate division KSB1 bacterium]|nr:MAG: hypothetical protein DCC62_22095 [candidate division KSB1 bacterium]
MIGQMLLNFKIIKKLGEGGMGVVYKAEDTKLERMVAIKFLPPEIAAHDEMKKRFKIEAKAAAALNHPNIATIYQIEEAEGELFIVMEYVEGQELRQLVKMLGFIPAHDAIAYAIQIAEGLRAAHEKGVWHRDIKSANVMLTKSGQIKIMDFGLAKLAGQSGASQEGTTMGTVAYMSPEQATAKAVDHRTDIWSFGVVLYEMLCGQLPFQAEYDQAMIYCILNVDPKPITSLQDAGVDGLQLVLDKALAKRPEDRYQEMEEVLTNLRALTGETKTGPIMRAAERHIVGREKELAELQKSLEHAYSGQSLLIGVGGEPGIGKTTLVEQFLDEVTISGRSCLIAQGQCSERLAGTEAYLPFLQVLESLLQKEADIPVANLMREKAPWWYVQVASLSSDDPANTGLLADVRNATQERVKRELAAFLQEISRKRPLVLSFEDLHWADISSIDMLAYLAAQFDAMRLLIVATYRPEELQLTKHPFLQIKPDLLSRGRCREIALGFLPQQEIEHFLKLEFPENTFPKTFARLIHDKTEGSPLFMVDLLQDLKNRNVIVEEDDRWQLVQSVEEIDLGLPDSVKGMIERKIKQLGEDDHRLMVAASVQGFEFDSAVVGKVLEMDEEEVEERLQKLEQDHRFVQFTEEDEFPDRTLTLRYRFVHALYQNELYSSLTRTRRARLSRTAAETLESYYGEKSGKAAAELASLFETARDFEKAVDYLHEAAKQAVGVFAYREAIAQTNRGLDILKTLPESQNRDKRELGLQMTLGSSATAVYGYADKGVRNTYLRIRELIDEGDATREVILSTFGLHSFYLSTLDMQGALDLCHWYLGLADSNEDKTLLFFGQALLGVTLCFIGDFASGLEHFEDAFAAYDPQMDDTLAFVSGQDVVLATWNNYPWNLWLRGFPDQAIQASIQAAELSEKRTDPHVVTHRFVFSAFLNMCLRDAEKVLQLSETNVSISEEHDLPWPLTLGRMHKGWALSQMGKIDEGLKMLHDGLAMFRAMGFETWRQIWHAEMAEVYGKMSQPEKGLELLAESLTVVDKTVHRMWEAELHRIKGELLLLQGEAESEVEACYEKALAVARKQEAKSFELRAAMSLGRLWQSQGKNEQAKELLNKVYNWFTEGFETRDLREAKQLLAELS